MKKRLDELVVDRGLASTKTKAQALIMAGEVSVAGQPALKPGHAFSQDAVVTIAAEGSKFVSRGGIKLEGALNHFHIDVRDLICLDVGASTGGFTDCLLQRGAKHVFTIDVGKGQLDPKIRNDPRVKWRESFHVKELTLATLGSPVDLAVVDVSFISLTKVLTGIVACLKREGILLALIKPQFEVTAKDLSKGGVLKNEAKRAEVIDRIAHWAALELHFTDVKTIDSVLKGPKGNLESFLYAKFPHL